MSISVEPLPQRAAHAGGPHEAVAFPKEIPVLAPGQEWRTFWDSSRDRKDSGLPDAHTASVDYLGIDDEPLNSKAVLDWSIYKSRIWVEVKGIHDLAKAVKEINVKLGKVIDRRALSVLVRSGAEQDRQLSEQAKRFREQHPQTGEDSNDHRTGEQSPPE